MARPDRIPKVKKTKDPNAPKRPLSAYLLWLNENRARLSKPGMPASEVAKLGGAEWRLLEDKSKWQNLAVELKAKYEKDIQTYKETKTE
ncbi:unnamed protein product [Caenorhabditis angaria]|uniref:HMG box domain-containing protein n=1 Tax=Caenorhabditis angaria TaxID=860376 RepID=A0A9P1I9D3_9PELO|nr:unnamed protein product [Caenorhabditis angaria]